MKWLFVAALLTVAGCDGALDCGNACNRRGHAMKTFDGRTCTCEAVAIDPDACGGSHAECFCRNCSRTCTEAGKKIRECRSGNDTWGAGPDACDCD